MSDDAEPVLNRRSDLPHAVIVDGAATGEDESFQPLAPQHVTLEQRIGYAATLIVCGIVMTVMIPWLVFSAGSFFVAILAVGGWIALLALLASGSHYWPPLAYRHTQWRLSDRGMEIRHGVLWKHRIAIPTSRVQHVDVSQGPFQRMFDLGKLTIHTAGTKNSAVELEGLQHAVALALRDQLIEQKEALDVT